MRIIEFSEIADRDLYNIVIYIAINLGSPLTAVKFFENIKKRILILERSPNLGRAINENYRVIYFKNYSIFYSVNFDEVIIKRIIYSRRSNLNSFLN